MRPGQVTLIGVPLDLGAGRRGVDMGPSAFRVVQIFAGGAPGACVVARGSTLQIGAAVGDFILCDDPLVDPQHCVIEDQAGTLILTDLGSRNGVFVRVQGEQELFNGDEIVIGRTHLVIALPASPDSVRLG